MTSKIKIKMGAIEIEYEGSEQFLKDELPALLSAVSELYKSSASLISKNDNNASSETSTASVVESKIQGTTATLAAKLGGGSGPELVMCAAARLTFVLGKDKFHRKELLAEMKTASSYYKSAYMNNLSKLLSSLLKSGKLMEPSTDNYSLSADSLQGIGAKLA
jgi:hypothetical protein